jgi:hypothetical protein
MKIRTTLTPKEIIKVNDMHREMKIKNPSVEFSEVKSLFFKERHEKDIAKAKKHYSKNYRKIRSLEKKSRNSKFLEK